MTKETPYKLIGRSSKDLKEFMQGHLTDIAASIIHKILVKYRQLPPSKKGDALKDISPVGINLYKSELADALSVIAREAIDGAKKEVPVRVKFAEYEDLPASVRRVVDQRGELTALAQLSDLEKAIYFEYINSIDYSDSEAEIQNNLVKAADSYIKGPSIIAGPTVLASTIVNSSRHEYFKTPEVEEKIYAYRFSNPGPISEVCKELVGRVFRADDPAVEIYRPPLHWNCKSYFSPIIDKVKITEGELVLSKAAQKAIQFHEGNCGCGESHLNFEEADMPEIKDSRKGNLQTVIISKDKAKTLDQAKSLAKEVGAEKFAVDETDTSYRFRQRNPGDFEPGFFKSFKIEEKGATLVYGKLK